jgi:hypothetical protein
MPRTNFLADFVALFYFPILFRLPDNILQNGDLLGSFSDFPDENMATVLRMAVKLTVKNVCIV